MSNSNNSFLSNQEDLDKKEIYRTKSHQEISSNSRIKINIHKKIENRTKKICRELSIPMTPESSIPKCDNCHSALICGFNDKQKKKVYCSYQCLLKGKLNSTLGRPRAFST